jgi:putative acetyltransferase
MKIRNASDADLNDVLTVARAAFERDEEAALVRDLLDDPSAHPVFSLLAFRDNHAAGHILFTRAGIEGHPYLTASILAPLAVVPEAQNQGIGGALIQHGLQALTASKIDLVFVLGYPDYYTRHGFEPAGRLGWDAPYPIPPQNADAWMVQPLRPGVLGEYRGRVICADKLDRPKYWRE